MQKHQLICNKFTLNYIYNFITFIDIFLIMNEGFER